MSRTPRRDQVNKLGSSVGVISDIEERNGTHERASTLTEDSALKHHLGLIRVKWWQVWRSRKWWKIGNEVFRRKSLLLDSANYLAAHKVDQKDALKLAATDVFVEKAQHVLSRRAILLFLFGIATAYAALHIMYNTAEMLYETTPLEILGIKDADKPIEMISVNNASTPVYFPFQYYLAAKPVSQNTTADEKVKTSWVQMDVNPGILTIVILKATTAGAFIGGVVWFLIMLSRALLHEAIVLYQRRHSLRFGRLYVYLFRENLDFKNLEEAFAWNNEFNSAFRDINTEKMPKPLQAEVMKFVEQTLKTWEHRPSAKNEGNDKPTQSEK